MKLIYFRSESCFTPVLFENAKISAFELQIRILIKVKDEAQSDGHYKIVVASISLEHTGPLAKYNFDQLKQPWKEVKSQFRPSLGCLDQDSEGAEE